MEPRFGHDFSGVRVHTDAQAAELARAVNAQAYAVGQDVVFGMGQYQPATKSGKQLIAHELTHVVQQQTGAIMRRVESNPPSHAESHTIRCLDPGAVETAFSTARAMLSTAQQQMKRGPIAISNDPRLLTPMHYFYMLFFKVEPGLRSMGQIADIRERFQFMGQALSSTRTKCVSGDHPDCKSGEMFHSAFAVRGAAQPLPQVFRIRCRQPGKNCHP